VSFEVESNDVANPFETLDRADVDFLIMPQQFLSSEHPSEPLYTDDYACLVSADNPEVGETLTAEQYQQLAHVVPRYRTRAAFVDEWFLSKQGIARRADVFASSFNAVPQLLVGTRRIATVHRRLADFYARHLPLRMLAVPFEIPELTEALQWHRYFDEDPGNRWLRHLLAAAAGAFRLA